MQRYWFAVIVAVLTAGIIGGGMFYICQVSLRMEDLVGEAEQALAAGDEAAALQKLKEGEQFWNRRQNWLEAVLDHAAVENICVPLAEITAYLEYGQPTHCAAGCRALIQRLQELRDGQQFRFSNIF